MKETVRDVGEFHAAYGSNVDPWIEKKGDKFHLDLKQINRWILNQAGVTHVDVSDDCTVCQPDRFWSHRICGGHRGTQGAIIVCPEAGI